MINIDTAAVIVFVWLSSLEFMENYIDYYPIYLVMDADI